MDILFSLCFILDADANALLINFSRICTIFYYIGQVCLIIFYIQLKNSRKSLCEADFLDLATILSIIPQINSQLVIVLQVGWRRDFNCPNLSLSIREFKTYSGQYPNNFTIDALILLDQVGFLSERRGSSRLLSLINYKIS